MAIDLWFKYKNLKNSNKSSIKSKAKIFLYVFIMIALMKAYVHLLGKNKGDEIKLQENSEIQEK